MEFLSAFFAEMTRVFNVRNFGYLKPSRVYNLDTFRHKQQDDLFINLERNMYQDPDYRGCVEAILTGKKIYTANRVDKIYMDALKERNTRREKRIENRHKKMRRI